jgi:hypothetical protein
MTQEGFYRLRDSLRLLRDTLPAFHASVLGDEGAPAPADWQVTLTRNVLPALDFPLPVLLVAICGGGSTGKSTLFNALAGKPLAQVGFKAGLTARVLLAGHPSVLSGPTAARALLYRLGEAPVPWRRAEDTVQPGPALYATTEHLLPKLLLIDTPDFDTGIGGEWVHRRLAEPVLRTAEVIVYLFSNTVYNNLSNTQFMAEVVGGIGGRPVVLVYRISRAANDAEVWEHCQTVANRLYAGSVKRNSLPSQVIGVYRVHESDAVAQGHASPRLIPVGALTAGRSLEELLASLDVAQLKAHAFAADLHEIQRGASAELSDVRHALAEVSTYRQALQQVMAQQALAALRAFPAQEAIGLATKLFLQSSPLYVRWLRTTGRVFGLPFQWGLKLAQSLARRLGTEPELAPAPNPLANLTQDLLLGANELRNRLLDDALIVRASADDPLLHTLRERSAGVVEPLGDGLYNLHVPVPRRVRQQEGALLAQDWGEVTQTLRRAARGLTGLPPDIEGELRALIADFRRQMGWGQRLRESFFASLSALPPLLGVTYVLLTADPVSGTGLWIQLQGLFGVKDLWALVSIPAAAGLSDRDRRELEVMLKPVFELWFAKRLTAVVDVYARTVCASLLKVLDKVPAPDDERLAQVEQALRRLGEAL